MKKNKQLIIVILLLVVCVGGYFGVKAYNANQEKKEEAKTMTPVNLQVSDITSFSYVNEGETLSFERDGENWKYTGDTSIDLSEDSVEGMLEKACTLTSTNKMIAHAQGETGAQGAATQLVLEPLDGHTVGVAAHAEHGNQPF